ncbi:helix-turn-helix transcriptional regulator [Nonomuraea sp. KC401]|uniref:winged helix-turn-helix transcriptional regulator n=1 Tax=unclassified Nonomuraea TaxID=2593643 RepID=UPI0010FCFCED|nr:MULTISPECIES: helix-turn-helix domain-containing protein [unclassified Nonomuraea]NBF00103.1 transcriptional regulator [Nonomuraea sp. K271]TLF53948.1 helix-turn-helix transcriptional regulator [Nonomuraea sp. KC401]
MKVNTPSDDRATGSRKSVPPADRVLLPSATADAIDLLSRRWMLQLLYVLCQGEARFSELARAVPGLSRRVLTDRLRELADQGLVHRLVDEGPPTRISYRLTDQGAALRTALEHIGSWAATYRPTRAS